MLVVDAIIFHHAPTLADFHGCDCFWMQITPVSKIIKVQKTFFG